MGGSGEVQDDCGRTSGNPFVGRAGELDRLDEALEATIGAKGQLVLVAGEPGIGKTRLAAEFSGRAAAAGTSVHWGRCWEGDGAPPFWPWVQVVRSYARGCEAEALRADLGRAAADIGRVVPEVASRLSAADLAPTFGSLGLQPEQERFRFFDGLTQFLKAAARRQPLVFILDDLQWADTSALLLLEFVARELSDAALCVVATYRDTDIDARHPLRTTLGGVVRETYCRRLPLGGLDVADVTQYVKLATGHAPPDDLVSAVCDLTDGNPFFLREIVSLLGSAGRPPSTADLLAAMPASVMEAVARRLGRLPEPCRELLDVAAVIGREFDMRLLRRVADAAAPVESVAHLLQPAASIGIVQVPLAGAVGSSWRCRTCRSRWCRHSPCKSLASDSGFPREEATLYCSGASATFAHALIRETLYRALPAARRLELHRTVARSLEDLFADDLEAHAAELAQHLSAAGHDADPTKLSMYARQAGDRARQRFAYEDAAHWYRQALDALAAQPGRGDPARCELLLALADAQMRAGDPAVARETSFRAAALARELGEMEHFGRAALGFGWPFDAGVVDRERIELLQEALERVDVGDSSLRARLMARLAAALYFVENSYARRATLSARAVEIARRVGDPSTLAFTLNARLFALWVPHATMERLELARELLRVAEVCGDDELALQSRHWLVMDLSETGDLDAARHHIDAHARVAARLRQPLYLWFAALWRASLATIEGRFEAAEREVEAAHALGMRAEPHNAQQVAMTQIFALQLGQGRLQDFADAAAAWRFEGAFEAAQACGRAQLFAEAARPDALRHELDAVARLGVERIPRDAGWLPAMASLSAAVAQAADATLARRIYGLLAPYADRIAIAGMLYCCFGAVSGSLALLATTLRDWTAADEHFRAALGTHVRIGARALRARTQHDWAAMLVERGADGDRARASALVAQAVATARELGMASLLERARALQTTLTGAEVAASTAPTGATLLRCEGEYWTLAHDGRAARLKDSKGLRYLAQLLRHPGREFHVLDLFFRCDGAAPVLQAGLEILDPAAKAAYRSRLEALHSELDEAEQFNDPGRAERARAEMDAITDQLAAAVGLGGRARRTAAAAERARSTVTQRIRAALRKIAEHQPALGNHLIRCVKTGTFCMYAVDAAPSVRWLLD